MTAPRPRGRRPAANAGAAASRSRPRRSRRRSASSQESQLTSLPTSRNAYIESRRVLLDSHGPVCAYCARRVSVRTITLDHVTPRRGQRAYDRHDNLVLACTPCNGKKGDTPLLAFLFARRERAENLLRYGMHLSPMLRELAAQIAGPEAAARAERLADPDYPYRD